MTYLVGGTPRSGKSTIRRILINDYKIPGITTDFLREGFEYGVPDFGIKDEMTDMGKSEILREYFRGLILAREDYSDRLLIEGTNFLPKYLAEFKENPKVKICFLGYCEVEPESKFRLIRDMSRQKADWTSELTDGKLQEHVDDFIKQSVYYRDECEKYGLKFFDTSRDFETVVAEAVRLLVN